VSKLASEQLCELFHARFALPCIVLRTARFFPEEDDDRAARESFDADNLKVNEYLYRRADIADVVSAHLLAAQRAPALGFAMYVISATTPFGHMDLEQLRRDAAAIVRRLSPEVAAVYERRGWRLPHAIDRVYVNERARCELSWHPLYDFRYIIEQLSQSSDYRSELAREVGSKGYHAEQFTDGPYPTEARR
jgi:UDP-glucose 4-epimerase